MSAPLTPAPRTRTSSSFLPGSGSGRSSTTSAPSWIVTARTGRNCTRTNQFVPTVDYGAEAPDERTSADPRQCPAAALARGEGGPRGRGALARSDLSRRRRGRRSRPAGAPDPGLPGGRRLARGDGQLAGTLRLSAEQGGHDRERGLLERGACPARAETRAAGRPAGASRRGGRPEPRWQPGKGARAPQARARVRNRHARLAAARPVGGPSARSPPARGGEHAWLDRRSAALQAIVPRRRLLRLVLGGPGGAASTGSRLRLGLLPHRRHRRLAGVPGPGRRARGGPGIAHRHGAQPVGVAGGGRRPRPLSAGGGGPAAPPPKGGGGARGGPPARPPAP